MTTAPGSVVGRSSLRILVRVKNEAVRTVTSLADDYGYASSAEGLRRKDLGIGVTTTLAMQELRWRARSRQRRAVNRPLNQSDARSELQLLALVLAPLQSELLFVLTTLLGGKC